MDKRNMSQKERIVQQAMEMFVSQGIKAVRMDDIAQQLGVSKRTLYELFGDKEGLLYLAMQCYLERHRQQWVEMTRDAKNVLEALFRVLGHVMDESETGYRIVENLRKFYPSVHRKLIQEGYSRNNSELRRMLEQGIADGLFLSDINVELAIAVFYHTAKAFTGHTDFLLPEGLDRRNAFTQIVSTFFRGIATARGGEVIAESLERWRKNETKKTNHR